MFRRRQQGAARAYRSAFRSNPRHRARKLNIEVLEDRRLMAVLTVTNLDDDSLANLAGGGLSLREAVEAINTSAIVDGVAPTSGAFGVNDEIRFAPSLFAGGPQTLMLTIGELEITAAMKISGPGAEFLTIDAGDGTDDTFNTGDGSRVFVLDDGNASLDRAITFTGLTLSGGDVADDGGAIYSNENLSIIDSILTGNATTESGGAVYARDGSLLLLRTAVTANTANDGGGVAVHADAMLNVSMSSLTINTAAANGGAVANFGNASLLNSTVADNDAADGAGIYTAGIANITTSTISGNTATDNGGGIYSATTLTDERTIITSSTISGNTAAGQGGGIYNHIGLSVIEFSTITRNTAPDGDGSGVASFGLGDTLTRVRSSITAGNTNSDVDFVNGATNSFESLGYNLIGNGNATANFSEPGDQTMQDPMLFGLADNGGPTETHMPMPGSPVIDMGNPFVFPGVNGVPIYDQRGAPFSRLQDGDGAGGARIDIGATELENPNNGPRVAGLFVTHDEAYPLFDPKPSIDGPTPLTHSITVRLADMLLLMPALPGDYNANGVVDLADYVIWRKFEGTNQLLPNDPFGGTIGSDQYDLWVANFGNTAAGPGPVPAVNFALAMNPNNYQLVGDFTGHVAIQRIEIELGPPIVGQPSTADIRLVFAKPLADDRYTLTVSDSIRDFAGNQLDGDSNAIQPLFPEFPSGDGFAGGDFVARFTIDSRPEIGSRFLQNIDIDTNGNGSWDPSPSQVGGDATNIDLSFTLPAFNNGSIAPGGFTVNDELFAGKFVNTLIGGAVPSRLFDQMAAYGNSTELGGFRWLIDTDSDGVVTIGADILNLQPALPPSANFNVVGAIPIAGNFDPNRVGDEIGLYNAGRWAFDTNGNFVIDQNDQFITGTLLGFPVVGDFDGDGNDDLGVFNNNTWYFDLAFDGLGTTNSAAAVDANGDRDQTLAWGFPSPLDKPLAADMDQDGIDDIGLWLPATAVTPGVAQWHFLVSGARTGTISEVASRSQFTASNLAGATIAPGELVRVMGAGNAWAVGVVQSFNSITGQITLAADLPIDPAVGDVIGIGGAAGSIEELNHGFSPAPIGNDISADFGGQFTLPIVGNFDPPVSAGGAGSAETAVEAVSFTVEVAESPQHAEASSDPFADVMFYEQINIASGDLLSSRPMYAFTASRNAYSSTASSVLRRGMQDLLAAADSVKPRSSYLPIRELDRVAKAAKLRDRAIETFDFNWKPGFPSLFEDADILAAR